MDNTEVALKQDRSYLEKNALSTMVNSQKLSDAVNTEWKECEGGTPVDKENVIYQILVDLFDECDKKAKEYLNQNPDQYYLLYNSDGTVNVNSIWWKVITDSEHDVQKSKELLLPFDHEIKANSDGSNKKNISHIPRKMYSTYHICCDSNMYGLLNLVDGLRTKNERGDGVATTNKEMIRCYMMLIALEIINHDTPPCLDDKPEWKCLFENHKNNNYTFAAIMFGDRHMDNRKYNYYCYNCYRTEDRCDDMNYPFEFKLGCFIATKISLSNDYMRKPGGHAYFGFTQSWSYSLLEKFPQIKGDGQILRTQQYLEQVLFPDKSKVEIKSSSKPINSSMEQNHLEEAMKNLKEHVGQNAMSKDKLKVEIKSKTIKSKTINPTNSSTGQNPPEETIGDSKHDVLHEKVVIDPNTNSDTKEDSFVLPGLLIILFILIVVLIYMSKSFFESNDDT